MEQAKQTMISVLKKQLKNPNLTEKQEYELKKSLKLLTT